MNARHFAALSKRLHTGLTIEEIGLLKDIGRLIDRWEQRNNKVVGCDVILLRDGDEDNKILLWNGEIFEPPNRGVHD